MGKISKKEKLFCNSSVRAGFTDGEYNVVLKSYNAIVPSKEQITAAEAGKADLPGGAVLKSVSVDGGHFYWVEDNGELIELNEELSDTGDYLAEENAILNESASIEEARRRTAEQNELFDGISKSLQPQLNKLDEILNNLPDDESGFRREMKYAGVLGAFVKRYSNLLLLSASEVRTDSSELYLCINESFGYLRLLDTACFADIEQGIELPVSYGLLAYGIFESVIESALTSLPAVFVSLKREENGPRLFIEVSSELASVEKSFFEAADGAGFTLETEVSDGCFFAVMKPKEDAI